MRLAFRPHNEPQTHYLSKTALKKMREEVWGKNVSNAYVMDRLRQYLQASSALSFACHGQVFTDEDLDELLLRAGDYVSVTTNIIMKMQSKN